MTARIDVRIPALGPWSAVVRAGERLVIVDVAGQQAVDALFYAADDPAERYGAAETVAAGRRPFLGLGSRLLSNEGRAMLTIVADDTGRHDTVAGCCSKASNAVRFGEEAAALPACRQNFLAEGARWGLTARDLVPNVNFFMNVPVEAGGRLAIADGLSRAGSTVELRAERDVIVLLSACPQINNPANGFDPTPVDVRVLP